jgi:hypothetical protein
MHRVEAVFVCAFDALLNPKIAYPQRLLSCALLYPLQSPLPVDNFSYFFCATQPTVRLSNCQVAKQPRKSGPAMESLGTAAELPDTGSEWIGSASGRNRKRRSLQENLRQARVKASPRRLSPGGNQQQFGEPTVLRDRRGARRRKAERIALGQRTSKFRRSGRW